MKKRTTPSRTETTQVAEPAKTKAERIVSLNGEQPSREQTSAPDLTTFERAATVVREATDPLVVIEQAIRSQGYGGDIRPAKLVHVGLTTRVLQMRPGAMPAHLLLLGQPSSGKNHALNVNLRLLPAAAYHVIDAGSPRVLIYDNSNLRHRAIIFGEADSLPAGEDNPAASAIRNLLQDHHLHYQVTVRDPESGSFTVQTIDKPGPTILVTTATRRLGEQLETRLFVVEVPDDQDQLRQALATQAALELHGLPDPDPAVIAYQALLQAQAPWDVRIPFVDALGAALGRSPVAARVLRDFTKLIALVKAVAVLRHPRRARDAEGRLVAEIEDYQTVYDLVRDAYATSTMGAGAGVRLVVEAVAVLRGEGTSPVAVSDVARRQGVHKSTASRHIRAAIRHGWLVNRDERRGRYDLDIGDPLPQEGLPTPAEVNRSVKPATMQPEAQKQPETGPAADGCRVAGLTERHTDPHDGPRANRVQRWARRIHLHNLAETWNWPQTYIGWGESVPAGFEAWENFIRCASDDRIKWATADFQSLGAGRA